MSGQTLTIDLTLDVARLSERAQVAAPVPVVDVTDAAVPSTLGADLLRDVPTSRDISQLINLVPGVAGDVAYGGSKSSNGLYVDGVDMTAPDEQGPWLRFNESWLREVQIVALGADARHGKFTGVTAYGVVRSGSNRFAGLGEYWTTQANWLSNNTRDLTATLRQTFEPLRIVSSWDAGGQLGGPIVESQLWFFGGVQRRTYDRKPAGNQGSNAIQGEWSLWSVPVSGGSPRALNLAGPTLRGVKVSPDGRRIALRTGEPTPEDWIMRATSCRRYRDQARLTAGST